MKFEDFIDFLNFIDGLNQKDFDTARGLLLLRAMSREAQRSFPPKSPPRGKLTDCDPSSKRKGAAPKSL